MERKNTWELYDKKQLKELEKINKEYRNFLDNGKTERECIDVIVNTIEAAGYRELEALVSNGETLKEGDKVYSVCMNKSVVMYKIGKKPISEGLNILGHYLKQELFFTGKKITLNTQKYTLLLLFKKWQMQTKLV